MTRYRTTLLAINFCAVYTFLMAITPGWFKPVESFGHSFLYLIYEAGYLPLLLIAMALLIIVSWLEDRDLIRRQP